MEGDLGKTRKIDEDWTRILIRILIFIIVGIIEIISFLMMTLIICCYSYINLKTRDNSLVFYY